MNKPKALNNNIKADINDITELKRAEKELRETEERLSAFMNSSPDGFFLLDPELNYVDINDAGLRLFPAGTKKEDIVGKNVVEIAPNIKETGRYYKYLEVLKTGKPFFVDDVVPHPKFGDVHLALRAFKVDNGLGIITTDITERKSAEEALRESEERYRTLYESPRDGIATANLKGFITECNQAYADMLGYSCEEIKKIKYQDLTPSKWHAFNEKIFREVMEHGYSDVFEKEYIRKDGTVFPVALHTWRIDDENGNPVGVGSIVRDITERKKVEENLRESREKYSVLAESSVDAIFIHDHDGRYLYANQACIKLFGRKPEEIVGKKLTDFFTKEKAEELLESIRHVFYKNNVVHIEYSFSFEGVIYYFFATLTPIRNVQGDVVSVMRVARDITERKKAEEALRVSEQWFRDLTETTTDWIWQVDKDGVYTYVSPKVKELLGYEVSEVLGRTPFDLMPKEEAKRVGKIFKEKVINKEPFYKLENVNSHKDGHLVVLETNGIPLFDEKGRLKGYRGIDRDITERKKREREIEYLKSFNENIVASIPSAILVCDKELKAVSINKTFRQMFNKKRKDIAGRPIYELLPKEMVEIEKLDKMIKKVFKTDEPIEIRDIIYASPTLGNRILNLKLLGMKVEEEEVEEEEVIIVIDDVTTVEKLREAEETSARIIEGAPIGIQVLNKKFVITKWNKGMERIFGVTKEEVEGKSVFELFPTFMKRIGWDVFNRVLKTGKAVEIDDFRYYSKEQKKELVLNLRYAPVKDINNQTLGIVGMIEDVTVHEELEREVQHEERLVVIGQLAAGIAHELNNPLAIVTGNIELALEELKEKGKKVGCKELEIAKEELDRCSEVAKRLLKLTEQTKLNITKVDLNQLVEDSLKLIKAETTLKDMIIQTRLSPRLRPIRADRLQLQQVFINLFMNSIPAMGENGILKIETRSADSGKSVIITVNDTGCGIKREDLRRIFIPFFSTKPRGEGSGLGLPIVKQIIDGHMGIINIRSKLGKGTRVTIKLPVKYRRKRRRLWGGGVEYENFSRG